MDIYELTENALFEFWKVVADKFPNATGGELSIDMSISLSNIAEQAITQWIELNVKGNN